MMNRSLKERTRYLLTLLGARLSASTLANIQSTLNYLAIGHWAKAHNFAFDHRVQDRKQVWKCVLERICNKRVLYLEFGVARGESITFWSRELKHPEAVLHGFDSFQGLPSSGGPWTKGQFSTGGVVPNVNDPRVRIFPGWFEEVLPTYSLPNHEILVINMDADIYSSTTYVLNFLRAHIRPGTFIYFDEMHCVDHEPRAFSEFITTSGLQFRAVCADKPLVRAFFECVADVSQRRTQDSLKNHEQA